MQMNHCKSCNTIFSSIGAFDMHRIGEFERPVYKLKKDGTPTRTIASYLPNTRRCMTESEMRAAGMTQNEKGWWGTGVVFNFWDKDKDQDQPVAGEATA